MSETRDKPTTWHARTLGAVRPRLPDSPAAAGVFAGDLLAVAGLLVAGLVHHGVPPHQHPLHALETIAPFALAWGLLAPAIGLYLRETLVSYRRTLVALLVGWPAITLLGGLVRSTPYLQGDAPVTFLLVNVALGFLVLLPWRVLATASLRRLTTG